MRDCEDCGAPGCDGWLAKFFGDPQAMTLMGCCASCGGITKHMAQVGEFDGGMIMLHCCEPCHRMVEEKMQEFHRQFAFLVANGVPRDKANKLIEQRIDAMPWPPHG